MHRIPSPPEASSIRHKQSRRKRHSSGTNEPAESDIHPARVSPPNGGRMPVAPCKRSAERSDARSAAWGSEPHQTYKARRRRANERLTNHRAFDVRATRLRLVARQSNSPITHRLVCRLTVPSIWHPHLVSRPWGRAARGFHRSSARGGLSLRCRWLGWRIEGRPCSNHWVVWFIAP